ncbi:MAG: GGDEF domain-containing phosphodiesterase [Acidobacteriota bacterium]
MELQEPLALSAELRPEAMPYRERLDDLVEILVQQGSLGVLLIDLSQLNQVEHNYGSKAFLSVLRQATALILKLRGTEVRESDILATSEKGGDAFLIFLSPKRTPSVARWNELYRAAGRIENYLNRNLARLALPYLRQRLNVTVGFGLVLHNPLVMRERLVARLVHHAWESVRLQRMERDFRNRLLLQEILLNEAVNTVFQPIVEMRTRAVLGYEALSRGPEQTAFHSPAQLFDVAAETDLVFELDRLCRRRALVNAKGLPPSSKIFVNVTPSSLYDPDFQGASLICLLDELQLAPSQVVLEITEKYAIENYSIFGEAIRNFTQMGFSIAVDDIGAGHSGLEKIANLSPRYLKFDMDLVRDIDTSYVRREMVKALKSLADKMDSTIIAEGIERPEELDTLLELGVEYGQGYLLGRPMRLKAPPVESLDLSWDTTTVASAPSADPPPAQSSSTTET